MSWRISREVFDGDGIDAGEGLIEEDEGGVGDERAGDFELAAFAAGEGHGFLVAGFGEAELVHEAEGFLFALGGGAAGGFEDGEEVLLDGEALEDAGFLGEVAHAAAGAFVHGQFSDVEAVELNLAAIGDDHAHDHAEGGGFAGPVAAEESDDFAVLDGEGDVVNDGPWTVAFDQVGGFEKDHPPYVGRRKRDTCAKPAIASTVQMRHSPDEPPYWQGVGGENNTRSVREGECGHLRRRLGLRQAPQTGTAFCHWESCDYDVRLSLQGVLIHGQYDDHFGAGHLGGGGALRHQDDGEAGFGAAGVGCAGDGGGGVYAEQGGGGTCDRGAAAYQGGRAAGVHHEFGVRNVCTGQRGIEDALEMCGADGGWAGAGDRRGGGADGGAAVFDRGDRAFSADGQDSAGVPGVVAGLANSQEAGEAFAEGILTTDLVAKSARVTVRVGGKTVTIAGHCKGSGMIAPNMGPEGIPLHATMLAYVATDAAIDGRVLAGGAGGGG